ncbi:uncharacterized protein LOC128557085 [Mercenaria mercenaria]|uniref:uncharacterized protein LOC128557085 n=1 Tax=Mercenaria mercenaria TaxID=6596 RepID=UPI00234EBF8F|nr:uncharacterized protein LOC128557085 [Mercenaria mercenaria]
MDTDREKEQSLQTSQVMARDVIKKLLNITYNINDKRTLKHIQESVCCLIDEVKPVESVPLLQLPKRLAKKKYRKRLSDLRQKNERNVPKGKGNIFKSPVPDIVDEDNMTVEVDDFLTMEEDYPVYMGECAISEVADEKCMEYQDSVIARGLVEKLWSLQTDLNTPVAKPYGILVSDTDIRSLRDGAWLTDNVCT